jgi:hypothetical protein
MHQAMPMSADEASHNITTKGMTVVGLVHPFGSRGWVVIGALWKLTFRFYAWRSSDGTLHRTELSLQRVITRERFDDLFNRTQGLAIVSARVRFLNDESAELLELLGIADPMDHELERIAAELRQPLIYQHPRFGAFTFERSVGRWEAIVDWAENSIQLITPGGENSPPEDDLLKTALELWDNQKLWKQRIEDYVVQKLLPLKNGNWLDDDEAPLSPDEFKARMSPESITVYDEGDFRVFYEDGDLFGGHWIYVRGNILSGLEDTTIMG